MRVFEGIRYTVTSMFVAGNFITLGIAHAEDAGRLTARGAGYALVISEKCSGQPQSTEAVTMRQRGLFTSLQRSGYDFEQIKAGYLEGVLAAEGRFPAGKKPPTSECRDAAKIKNSIDQLG